MKSDQSGQYFEENPQSKPSPTAFKCRFEGIDFEFKADSGVFSKKKADFGSCLLIEKYISERKEGREKGTDVLDLGCGYGLLGIVLKRVFPAVSITMSDINSRALEYAGKNAENNHIKYAKILISDGFENIHGLFDTVLMNPPVRAGKQTVFRLYSEAFGQIKSGGDLYVVIQTKQGAGSSARELERLFGNCNVIVIKAGYRILKCIKQHQEET